MIKRIFIFILFIHGFSVLPGFAQKKSQTISGFVKEQGSGELLPGVNVFIPELKSGTITNTYGFYTLTILEGEYSIEFSYVGYKKEVVKLTQNPDTKLDIQLIRNVEIEGVEIKAEKSEKLTQSSDMSVISVPVQQIRSIPALLGEKDVFRTLQLMPGVQKGGEGSTGIYVRGGGPDQNLIILDDAVVYNASHLFGFFSLFNGDALKSVELTKGGFPARYGGRLSSVVEMNMKDGNKEKSAGEFGVGLISSRVVLEGPIVKNKVSYLFSARRTYLDLLMRPFMPANQRTGFYFYDLNAKINWDLGRNNKLYLSGYFGRDKFYFIDKSTDYNGDEYKDEFGLYWQNATTTLRWNHLYNSKLFSNTSLIFSNFGMFIYAKNYTADNDYSLRYNSGIRDFTIKTDLEYHPSVSYHLRAGIVATQHRFIPSALVEKGVDNYLNNNHKTIYDTEESGIYIENHYDYGSRMSINAGLRLSSYFEKGKTYFRPEPRFSANYILKENFSVKLAYAEMNQYIHLLSNTGIGLPTDLWVPSTPRIPPQHSQQISAGLARDFQSPEFSMTLEGYSKKSRNIIGYKQGASFLIIDDPGQSSDYSWENNITSGESKSYGMELLLQKKRGKFNGWIGYTLSWTKLRFDDLNHGEWYFAKYDRRHDLSVVCLYNPNERISWSATWVYGTGNAITLPQGTFDLQTHMPAGNGISNLLQLGYPREVHDFGKVNDFRMRSYHRLDLGVQLHMKLPHYISTWELSVYNAYNRHNPYFYFVESTFANGKSTTVLKQVSLFPIIPSISYSIKF